MLLYTIRRAFRKRARREDEGMDIPKIVGDGLYDDTAGIQALFDGKPVDAAKCVVFRGAKIRVTGGVFRLKSLIFIPDEGPEILWDSCRWNCEDITPEEWQNYKGYGIGPFRYRTLNETPSLEKPAQT